MDFLLKLLNSEAGVNLVILGFGVALTAIKGMDWYQKSIKDKYDKSVDCVSAAVVTVGQEYANQLKAANADGKLTDEEAAEARRRAIEYAKELGQKQGVDIIKLIGEDFIDSVIARQVNKVK